MKLLLERDPLTTIDALGGEVFLRTPEGRPRLSALVDWLRDDTWNAKHQPGGSRGWLAADPRFAVLCASLARDADKSLAALARDLVATLPKELRPKAPRPKSKPKTRVPVQVAPDAALLEELTNMQARLARLVRHLREIDYRFAEPKHALVAAKAKDLTALARLEKKVVVPPALAAFWRIVGSIDLRGEDPKWPVHGYLGFPGAREPVWLSDPLVIAPAAQVIADALEEHAGEPFGLGLAPDRVGKAGYSGGILTLWLPQPSADPCFDDSTETLLGHLRRALSWGGFPGFAAIDERPDGWLEGARKACE